MDDRPNPLEERPFVDELPAALAAAVGQVRAEEAPAASLRRSLERARRLGPGKVNPWLRYHRVATAAAAAAVLLLTFGLLLLCVHFEPAGNPQAASGGDHRAASGDGPGERDVSVGVDHDPAPIRADDPPRPGRSGLAENAFVEAERDPVSTFPLAEDPTAYGEVRRALLEQKRLPAPEEVRVAGVVNAFAYSYPQPTENDPVSLTLDLATCPWNGTHHLARVGLRGRPTAAPGTAVQVTFNARRVAAYRLIGYEGRGTGKAGAGGETFGAGRTVTALYEVVPAGGANDGEWLRAAVRGRDSSGQAWAVDQHLRGPAAAFAEASADFRFAAAAAEFGLLLRRSAYRGRATFAAVRAAVQGSLGDDPDGRRAEFLALVDAADRLSAGREALTQRRAGGVSPLILDTFAHR